jgi:hypothetical protein
MSEVQRYLQIGSAMCPAVDSGGWVSAFDYDALASKLEQYKDLCAAMYQMAGLVGAPERFLDALHDAASGQIMENPIETLLPTTIEEYEDSRGCVTASYNEEGCIVAVTRQDQEGRILSVIAEPHTREKGATRYTIHEVADLQKCQRYYLDPAFQEQVEAHTHIGLTPFNPLNAASNAESGVGLKHIEQPEQGFYNGKALCYSMMTTTGDRWVLDKVVGRDWEFFSDAVAWGNANGYLVEMESSLPKEHQDDEAN